MWHRLNLRTRIYTLLAGMLLVTLASGSLLVWHTYRIQSYFTDIVHKDMTAYETAMALETALVNQKGFVSYFFLDGNPAWLQQLQTHREIFDGWLRQARNVATEPDRQAAVQKISQTYAAYIARKDQVVAMYTRGEREAGARLHQTIRHQFFDIIALCEAYKLDHAQKIKQAQARGVAASQRVRTITAAAITAQMLLVLILGMLLIRQILLPVHRILKNTAKNPQVHKSENVVSALSSHVDNLIRDVDQAHQELEKSRENLQQAEKMALVGKLAAGMAHSIRNPFTSVKMRLFSLGRALKLNPAQQEDFEVISQEIRHIDTIVQNFLEFSRPPKLVMQSLSPSSIVDHSVQLLAHRLDSYGVAVTVRRTQALPEVMADPEQLKEVLVNLIINACEEMKAGGAITIEERVANQPNNSRVAMLRIADSGPGISPANREKIFQPFFTTKDEGTGLGLSISQRIISEHGGSLTLDAGHAAGAAFVITLPIKEPAR